MLARSTLAPFFLLAIVCFVAFAQEDDTKSITVLGLGGMGQSMTKCLASHGYKVHTWNRGTQRREQVKAMDLDGVTVHDNAQDAVAATDTSIVMFASEAELKTVQEFVKAIPKKAWKGKTLVNFASQEPFAAIALEETLKKLGVEHVGGAMLAIPETICTPGSVVLASASDRSIKALENVTPALSALGRLETYLGDVGYGALIDVGVVQSIFFGLTGFEMSLLYLEKYGVTEEIMDRYIALCKELSVIYYPMLFGIQASSIRERNWPVSFATAKSNLALAEMHGAFFKKIGIDDANMNNLYLKVLQKTVDVDPEAGSASVVRHYSVDGFTYEEKKQEL